MINETLNNMTNSATMVNNELVKTLRTQGKPVYALGFGQSPFPPPDKLIANLKTHASHNEYLPVQGLPQLRQDIATYYSQRDIEPSPSTMSSLGQAPNNYNSYYIWL